MAPVVEREMPPDYRDAVSLLDIGRLVSEESPWREPEDHEQYVAAIYVAATPIQVGAPETLIEERLHALCEAGVLQWSGRRLEPARPVVSVLGSSGG